MKVVLFILRSSLERHGWRTFLDRYDLSGLTTSEWIRAAMRCVEHFAKSIFFNEFRYWINLLYYCNSRGFVCPARAVRTAMVLNIFQSIVGLLKLGVDVPPTESYNIFICNAKNVIFIEIWFRKAKSSPPKKEFVPPFGGFWIARY